MMKRGNLQFTLFFLYCIDRCTAVNKCYYPGGGESLDDAPCDPDAEVSVCCGRFSSGGGCLSNKLCMGIDGRMSRGSCTDKNWLSPECPNFCTGIVVTPCLNGNDSSTTHCCFLDRICCSDESALFEAPPARPVTTATWNSKSSRYISFQLQPSTSLSSTKTSTSSLSTAPLTSTSTESTATTASRSITTTEPASSTTTPESTPSSPGNQPQSQPQPQQQQQQPGTPPPSNNSRYSHRRHTRRSPHRSSSLPPLEAEQKPKITRASSRRKPSTRKHTTLQPSIWLPPLLSAFTRTRDKLSQGAPLRSKRG
ncbi:uncharacterized protein PODANS_1_4320 [Podospora anserina S mat+]|uniref:Podospora anserina S mat+ genomic DNA chromosome 1, supercontig 1 n=1 Tax=Podospora anserina (strain S / ATCC MYA-4624 / DSM 980 / FGSC 10383) TaxID=515849 RepID=B2AAK4_PODAN|nr:uncharacterized protein PODANS_1_4320 [Podospora anserina S mat+]CAP60116.1 unnamed protein product [Podospora anserina S mat+]